MDYKCPICGKDMRLIPAGTSKKTGRKYNAFYACEDYGCKGTRQEDGSVKQPYVNKPYSNQEVREMKIEKNIEHKDKGMKFYATRRDAVATALAFKTEGWTEDIFKDNIKYWINFYENEIYADKKEIPF